MSMAIEEYPAAAIEALEQQSDKFDLREFQRATESSGDRFASLVPLLPHILRLKGQPMTLERHYPFEPFF